MSKIVALIIAVVLAITALTVGTVVMRKKKTEQEAITKTNSASEITEIASESDTDNSSESETESAIADEESVVGESTVMSVTESRPASSEAKSTTEAGKTTAKSEKSGNSLTEQKATKKETDWKKAYYDFYMSKGYLDNVIDKENRPEIGLKDMDNDGIPELLVGDPWDSGTYGHGIIYTYSNGSVKFIGTSEGYGGHWSPHAVNDSRYPGVFTYIWQRGESSESNDMPFHIIYYYVKNGEVEWIDVAADYTEEGEYDRLTDDVNLYNAVINNEKDYSLMSYSDVSSKGWDSFCAEYGY